MHLLACEVVCEWARGTVSLWWILLFLYSPLTQSLLASQTKTCVYAVLARPGRDKSATPVAQGDAHQHVSVLHPLLVLFCLTPHCVSLFKTSRNRRRRDAQSLPFSSSTVLVPPDLLESGASFTHSFTFRALHSLFDYDLTSHLLVFWCSVEQGLTFCPGMVLVQWLFVQLRF